jgi:hypothetical protein
VKFLKSLVSQLYWACLLYSHVIFYLTVIVNPSQLIPKSFPPLDSLLLIQQLYMAGACMKFGHLMTSSSLPLCKSHKKCETVDGELVEFRVRLKNPMQAKAERTISVSACMTVRLPFPFTPRHGQLRIFRPFSPW